jgi:acetyl esterase
MSSPIPFVRLLPVLMRVKLLGMRPHLPPLGGGVLDEQIALMRRAQELLEEEPMDQCAPEQNRIHLRDQIRILKRVGGLFENVHSVRSVGVPGPAGAIPCRLYTPGPGPGLPLVVYFHGGGFVVGDLDTADNVSRFICRRAGCAVLSVDYRLAPEHRFPAAVEDGYAAFVWAVDHAAELGCDHRRVLVAGDSAGGTLAAVVTQTAHRSGGPRPVGQVLFYASTDSAVQDTPSYREFGGRSLGLTARDVEWFLGQYIPDRRDRLDPRASPLRCPDLRGLAPAIVVTAEFDVLRDEAETYARLLREAGVPVTLMRCNGMIHGFLSAAGLIQRATVYFDQIAAKIREAAVSRP